MSSYYSIRLILRNLIVNSGNTRCWVVGNYPLLPTVEPGVLGLGAGHSAERKGKRVLFPIEMKVGMSILLCDVRSYIIFDCIINHMMISSHGVFNPSRTCAYYPCDVARGSSAASY